MRHLFTILGALIINFSNVQASFHLDMSKEWRRGSGGSSGGSGTGRNLVGYSSTDVRA